MTTGETQQGTDLFHMHEERGQFWQALSPVSSHQASGSSSVRSAHPSLAAVWLVRWLVRWLAPRLMTSQDYWLTGLEQRRASVCLLIRLRLFACNFHLQPTTTPPYHTSSASGIATASCLDSTRGARESCLEVDIAISRSRHLTDDKHLDACLFLPALPRRRASHDLCALLFFLGLRVALFLACAFKILHPTHASIPDLLA